MGSRIRENPHHIFECYCEVVIPSSCNEAAWILQKFPENYNEKEILKSVPSFAYPCEYNNNTVQHFSFVLTNIDSKWTFGFCRHTPNSPTCHVLLSALPWHETFYAVLNNIVDLANREEAGDLWRFLEALYHLTVPEPGYQLHVVYNDGTKKFVTQCPDHHKLPSVPGNRNLAEYVNAIDVTNMTIIFASMLHERRILITSNKLNRLSSCVQAANALIYPMNWQHIFIPVLPNHLLDYLSAPMPFLIGVPAVTMARVKQAELGELVILNADSNKIETPFDDLQTLPPEIVSNLKRNLRNPSNTLGDGVARGFLRALVQLIGGYREALKMKMGERISFDPDAFIQSRPNSMQQFLEKMLHLQIFQQFIEDRLDLLNSGQGFSDEFEFEVNTYEDKSSSKLRSQYREWAITMKKEGGALLKTVRTKVKDKSRRAYKDLRLKLHDIQQQKEVSIPIKRGSLARSAPSSPTASRTTKPSETKNGKVVSYIKPTGAHSKGDNFCEIPETRTRQYNLLSVDELTKDSDNGSLSDGESTSNLSFQPINMDFMGELQDLLFQRFSLNPLEQSPASKPPPVDRSLKPQKSLPASPVKLNSSGGLTLTPRLPAPLPPPRTKHKMVQASYNRSFITAPSSKGEHNEPPLICLEELDDVEVFDPLLTKQENKVSSLDDFQLLSQAKPNQVFIQKLKETLNSNRSACSVTAPITLQSNPVYSQCFVRPRIVSQPQVLPPQNYHRYPIPGHFNPFVQPFSTLPHPSYNVHPPGEIVASTTSGWSRPVDIPSDSMSNTDGLKNVAVLSGNYSTTTSSLPQTGELFADLVNWPAPGLPLNTECKTSSVTSTNSGISSSSTSTASNVKYRWQRFD
ncbi:DENN domain-containing protein 1B-like isoform X1 [Tachypleus tridentatus]|uniref:DENN domain-containing protein 1B-like isoform X1 n=1 Tax=Tachypleus tridentatus TaxID=6853 RepID=UPI003FD2B692